MPAADHAYIYAVGPADGMPIKIGHCGNLKKRLGAIQAGNWIDLAVHYSVAVADLMLARRIEDNCHQLLDKTKKAAAWRLVQHHTDLGAKTDSVLGKGVENPAIHGAR